MWLLDGNPIHCVESNRDLACLVPRHTSTLHPSPLAPTLQGEGGSRHKYGDLAYLHDKCELSVESEQ